MLLTFSGPNSNDSAALNLDQETVHSTFRQTYHEIADRHLVEADVIEQLRSNIAALEDMHGRLKFVMAEVGYLLKKS